MEKTNWLYRPIAIALAILTVFPVGAVASAQETPGQQATQTVPPLPPAPPPHANPDASSSQPANPASEVAALPDSPSPQAEPGPQQQSNPQPAPQQQQPTAPSQPTGTAAAPAEPAGGVAATRPAGAAIAPARQKRSHTLLIRWSLVIGAAVAVGTVVGLSSASSSRP